MVLCGSPCSNDAQSIPDRLVLKLTTPFELVHNTKPDSKTWFELFLIGYFNHTVDNTESRSKLKARTLYGITVGRYDNSHVIIFYNPLTYSYYHPPDLCLDESQPPINNFPSTLRFDGGLTCGLLQNNTDPIHEPLLPVKRVSI